MEKSSESTKRDRIRVEKDQIERYRELAGIGSPSGKNATGADLIPFTKLSDVFMFAVCIGFRMKKRTKLDSREDLIYVNYLSEHTDIPTLQSIAVSETGGIEVLGNMNHLCTIAEEYANTGFEELCRVVNGPGKSLVNLLGTVVDSFPPQACEETNVAR